MFSTEQPHEMIAEVPLLKSSNDDDSEIIAELRDKLSGSEEECVQLRQRLNEMEGELRNMLNDQQMNLGTYEETIEKLMRERETLVKGLEAERSSLLEQLEAA